MWVSVDTSFHGGSNDIIGGRVRLRRPEISLSSHGGILVLDTRFIALQKEQTSVGKILSYSFILQYKIFSLSLPTKKKEIVTACFY
jgi:hypothetical protein